MTLEFKCILILISKLIKTPKIASVFLQDPCNTLGKSSTNLEPTICADDTKVVDGLNDGSA